MGVKKSSKKIINSKKIKGKNKKNKNIKEYFLAIWNFIKDKYNPNVVWMFLPFILMDGLIFIFGRHISYSYYKAYGPILFTISWITFFMGFSRSFKLKYNRIFYLFFSVLFAALFLVNNVYYSMTKTFFDFTLMESASEGAPYILDTLKNCNPLVYLAFIVIIISIILGYRKIEGKKENDYKLFTKFMIAFLLLHTIAPFTLGKANKELTWSSWRNPRNVYNAFNDSNKSIKVSGFYEYTFRNFYVSFLKTKEQINVEDIEFLEDAYSSEKTHKNTHSGLFKDKNLILIQLEGTDNWLLNEKDTPTLHKMMNEGINFNNHYSYYNGGGSTFNSEFAVNTGFITPLSFTKNAYQFNKNEFPNSLAHIFKDMGYSVNAFHKNTGEYYSRTVNYINWGYDNYYGLIDVDKYTDSTYNLDRELILNEKFNKLIIPEEGKFVDYIITYSGHLPFTNTKGVCKYLYDEDIEKQYQLDLTKLEEGQILEKPEFVQMTEEECARRQSRETDYMIELLLKKLEETNKLDDTVIVVFTDHYLYTLEDKSILDKYKETSNNLINRTPFFIWSKDIRSERVNKVTSQLNILPTVLNLFGVEYKLNSYIGEDALDGDYEGIVFFSDYSWYDGNVYVENGEVVNGKSISLDKLEEKNHYISYITKKNDLTLKNNYFKNKSSE